MRKQSIEGRNQFAMLTIDDLVPKDHLVRKIDAAIQFDFIYPIIIKSIIKYCNHIIKKTMFSSFVKCIFIHT